MKEQKFYICKHCGNIIAYVKSSGVSVVCCGDVMSEILPGIVDASREKHIPIISINGNTVTVTVGDVLHPMTQEHYIQWISLQSIEGNQRKELKPGDKPQAVFTLSESDHTVSAYAYCNLHSLWKTTI